MPGVVRHSRPRHLPRHIMTRLRTYPGPRPQSPVGVVRARAPYSWRHWVPSPRFAVSADPPPRAQAPGRPTAAFRAGPTPASTMHVSREGSGRRSHLSPRRTSCPALSRRGSASAASARERAERTLGSKLGLRRRRRVSPTCTTRSNGRVVARSTPRSAPTLPRTQTSGLPCSRARPTPARGACGPTVRPPHPS